MRWAWIRVREGLRWLFRGSNFRKLDHDIERMAAPLAHQGLSEKKAAKASARIAYALSWMPPERAEKFHEMMARFGHATN